MPAQTTREVVETEYSSSEMKELWSMDVDKIVAILKSIDNNRLPLYYYRMDNINKLGEEHTYSEKDYFNTKEHAAIEKAIELLEKQDYCTWKTASSKDTHFNTECGAEYIVNPDDLLDGMYCPHCGRKVRVEV